MKFTKIPTTTFSNLQLNAGVYVKDFDPTNPVVDAANLIGATTGGSTFTATPTYTDYGADIDNAPVNVKELKRLDSWTATMSGTFVTITVASAKTLVGAADVDEADATHIIPRNTLDIEKDFEDIWWIGDYSDENGEENGGFVAIHIMNALSTGGFTLSSTNRGKGTFAFTYTAHYSIENQDVVPYEIYIKEGEAESEGA